MLGIAHVRVVTVAFAAVIGCGGSVDSRPTGGDGSNGASGSSGASWSSGSSGSAGSCGAAPGCNALQDLGPMVMPTCTTGSVPTGQGGTIVDGTYVLTSQTYYGAQGCPHGPLSTTIVISQGCIQLVGHAGGVEVRASESFTVQGAMTTGSVLCEPSTGGTPDAPTQTYTATPTSYTRFTDNSGTSSSNDNRVEVFMKR